MRTPKKNDATGQDGAMIGDIITQVIAAIQPMVINSVTTAVTAAVATAFKQMREEFQAVETMKGEVKRVNENMARLAAKLQTQHFELDREEQYSRKDSVIIYGIPDPGASFFFRGTHKVRDELQLSHFVG